MRKIDELALYARLRAAERLSRALVMDACEQFGIHPNRAFYLMQKWSDAGWIDYGVHVFCGWFTPEAPEHLQE